MWQQCDILESRISIPPPSSKSDQCYLVTAVTKNHSNESNSELNPTDGTHNATCQSIEWKQLNPTHTAQLMPSVRVSPRPQIFALPRHMYTQVLRSSLFQGSPSRGLSPDFGRKRKEDVNWRKIIAGTYIQKGGFRSCRTPKTIWIFRRKIVWERENYSHHCPFTRQRIPTTQPLQCNALS